MNVAILRVAVGEYEVETNFGIVVQLPIDAGAQGAQQPALDLALALPNRDFKSINDLEVRAPFFKLMGTSKNRLPGDFSPRQAQTRFGLGLHFQALTRLKMAGHPCPARAPLIIRGTLI